jgi:hypothetical protein
MLHLVIGDEVNKLRSAMFLKEYVNAAKIVSLQRAVQIRWHMSYCGRGLLHELQYSNNSDDQTKQVS